MSPVRLVAVGDISFGDNAVCASFGIGSTLRTRPHLDMFEHVKHLFGGSDLVFGNLETVLSEDGFSAASLRSLHMRGSPASIDQPARAGFNVLNVANNHILQHGERAFYETLDLLESKGILAVGVAGRNGFHCEPARIDVRGTEVVFLGYAFERDKYYPHVPLYAQTDLTGISADIRRVKTPTNLVVCSFHWGREFVPYPSRDQITIGRGAIDAGCDLVLGHHPHVLNGFESYKDRLVFYSLGNFVFDQLWNDGCLRTMAIHVALTPVGAELIRAQSVHIGSDYRPVPFDDPAFDETLKGLSARILDNADASDEEHRSEASRLESRNRYSSWRFMLRYIHRYRPVLLLQIVMEALKRRLPQFADRHSAAEGG